MLQNLFHEEISEIIYFKDKELSKENVNLKCGICDMVVETKTSILLIEMQNKNLKDFKKRLKRYMSILYATQKLKKDYEEMKAVKLYLILNYKEGEGKVLKKYKELEEEIKEQFDYLSDIMVWNIREALEIKSGMDYDCARLFVLDEYSKEEAIEILKELYTGRKLKEEVEKIIIYNLDIETYQRLKEERYMFETTFELETSGLRAEAKRIGLMEGREEGIKEGKLETALFMLREGLEVPLIKKVTGLGEQQIIEYKEQKEVS